MLQKPYQEFLATIIVRFSSPVLLYHATCADPSKISVRIHNVPPEILHEHLTYLKRHYTFVTADEFAVTRRVRGLAAVTFDDAYTSVFEQALPVFESLDIPFTVFINTVKLEGRIFWRDKVRFIIHNNLLQEWESFSGGKYRIKDISFYRYTKHPKNNSKKIDAELDRFLDGRNISPPNETYCIERKDQILPHPLITYGNHSRNHFVLSSLSPEEQFEEIDSVRRFLDGIDGIQRSNLFSIPFGGLRHISEATEQIIRDLGYHGYLLSQNRLNRTVLTGEPVQVIERLMPKPENIDDMMRKMFREGFFRLLRP
jgi:peptidoglycan/xylan/chitin deacetylase (PgdA/CDA1 family)